MKLLRIASLLVVLAACSGSTPSNGAAPAGNGVNDVLAACQIRAQWTNASTTACTTCIGLAESPRCACTDQDYAGKCSDQATAMHNEPTCDTTLTQCVAHCPPTDCACIDGCYTGKAACRVKASATDGCLAAVCDAYCR